MQAVILAAGKSTRTHPLTLSKPKPLLAVANKTLLEHNLLQLDGLVEEAIIIVGFKADLITEKFGNSFGKLKLKYVEQKEQLGNGHALLMAKHLLKGKFIVINGDDMYSRKDLVRCLKHKYALLISKVANPSRFGVVVVNDGVAADFEEKPEQFVSDLANTGVYVFDTSIFGHDLEKSPRGEYEITDYVKFLMAKDKVHCETVNDYWLPIGYPWSLLDANEVVLKGLKRSIKGKVEKGATIKGAVHVGKGTLIRAGSYIERPVIIGENCAIGPNCYIRPNTSIGDNCKVGNAVEVKASILMNHVSCGHLSYVGDSVLGDNVNLGAGTITANWRHDNGNIKSAVNGTLLDSGRRKLGTIIGEGVHTGIHTSIYPGRKIWPGKSTLPGEIVKKDIEL